jgi:hypothetical protein
VTSPRGLLLAAMTPPPSLEEEFNEWYDSEHVPERLRIPGFDTGRRFISVAGWPRYLALYDLDSPDVLESAAYAAMAGANFSPWTKRIVPRMTGRYRAAAEQIYPGRALIGGPARLVLLRFRGVPSDGRGALVAGLREAFERASGISALRVFKAASDAGADHLAIVESSLPNAEERIAEVRLGESARWLDLAAAYAPYWRE